MVPVLKIISGPGAGRVVRLEQPVVTVGRGDENDLVIDDLGVSRQHCKFVLTVGRVTLVDLDSTNGTFVAGKRIRSRTLDDGILILLGTRVKLRFAFLAPEEKELEQHLYEAATRDLLTGALNRRSWLGHVREALKANPQLVFSIALLDLDHFKKINDTHGHGAGDAALVEFCRRTRGMGRDLTLGRWGGEEFIFFLPKFSLDRAGRRLERLREEVADVPFQLGPDLTARITVSIGVGEGKASDVILEDLIANVDQALYESKKYGRNRVTPVRPKAVPAAPADTPRPAQRRRQSRKPCKLEVWCQSQEQSFEGRVIDIGTGGLNLLTATPLAAGAELEIRLKQDPSAAVRVAITWREERRGRYGAKFLDGPERLRVSWVSDVLRALGINANTSRERRADVRFEAPCVIVLEGAAGSYTARMVNLGMGGLAVEAALIPPVGPVLRLKVGALDAPVKVVWAAPPRCGLCFAELSPEQTRAVAVLTRQAASAAQRKTSIVND